MKTRLRWYFAGCATPLLAFVVLAVIGDELAARRGR